jgi:hypothetical protein
MGVIKLTKVAVWVWATSPTVRRASAYATRVGQLNGRPERPGCLPNDAAVTPAVIPATVSAGSPIV